MLEAWLTIRDAVRRLSFLHTHFALGAGGVQVDVSLDQRLYQGELATPCCCTCSKHGFSDGSCGAGDADKVNQQRICGRLARE